MPVPERCRICQTELEEYQPRYCSEQCEHEATQRVMAATYQSPHVIDDMRAAYAEPQTYQGDWQ